MVCVGSIQIFRVNFQRHALNTEPNFLPSPLLHNLPQAPQLCHMYVVKYQFQYYKVKFIRLVRRRIRGLLKSLKYEKYENIFLMIRESLLEKKLYLESVVKKNQNNDEVRIVERGESVRVKGSRGHNSFFMREPISEGKYYMEVEGFMPSSFSQPYKNTPSFRIGIVPDIYFYNYPLGQNKSITYKITGQMVTEATAKTFAEPFVFGDRLGMSISISKPFSKLHPNLLTFYKNGKKMGYPLTFDHQTLYAFAVSVYNEAEVQIYIHKHQQLYRIPEHRPYGEYFDWKTRVNT